MFVTKTFKCEKCDESFSQHVYLTKHIWAVHKESKTFKCEYCSKGFMYEGSFKTHLISCFSKSKLLGFKCAYCEKSFSQSEYLNKHTIADHEDILTLHMSSAPKAITVEDVKKETLKPNIYNVQYFKCYKCCQIFDDLQSLNDHKTCKFKANILNRTLTKKKK